MTVNSTGAGGRTGWRKSRRSNPDGHCVEVARAADGTIGVRDTKQDGTGPVLRFTRAQWAAFVTALRTG